MEAVIESATMASVTELVGKLTEPLTYKLVEVAEADTKSVDAKLIKKPLVEVTLVPVAVVKPKAPESVPPVRSK